MQRLRTVSHAEVRVRYKAQKRPDSVLMSSKVTSCVAFKSNDAQTISKIACAVPHSYWDKKD